MPLPFTSNELEGSRSKLLPTAAVTLPATAAPIHTVSYSARSPAWHRPSTMLQHAAKTESNARACYPILLQSC